MEFPEPAFSPTGRIQNTESVVDSDLMETTPHGKQVLHNCYNVAPEVNVSLYQAADENGNMKAFDYAGAVDLAINHEVDIVNVSYGHHSPGCQGDCPFCYATEKAIENDLCVVVAAGNRKSDDIPVHCPAIKEDVIAVAGMVTQCEKDTGDIPVGAFQMPNLQNPFEPEDMAYCGQRGCEDGINGFCAKNRKEEAWIGNPTPVGEKPDILAPVHIIMTGPDNEIQTHSGTSYAAPLVSGALALVYDLLRQQNLPIPNAYQARELILEAGLTLPEANTPKLDVSYLLEIAEDRMDKQNTADAQPETR